MPLGKQCAPPAEFHVNNPQRNSTRADAAALYLRAAGLVPAHASSSVMRGAKSHCRRYESGATYARVMGFERGTADGGRWMERRDT